MRVAGLNERVEMHGAFLYVRALSTREIHKTLATRV